VIFFCNNQHTFFYFKVDNLIKILTLYSVVVSGKIFDTREITPVVGSMLKFPPAPSSPVMSNVIVLKGA
jgi:hypothetical protein